MKYVLIWLIIFILFYLLYLFFVILRKKKLAKFKESTYVKYLSKVYKLDIKKINNKKLVHLIALANSFIIATTFTIILGIENYLLMVFLTIIIIIPLSLLVYHLVGLILKRSETK